MGLSARCVPAFSRPRLPLLAFALYRTDIFVYRACSSFQWCFQVHGSASVEVKSSTLSNGLRVVTQAVRQGAGVRNRAGRRMGDGEESERESDGIS